MASEWLAPVSDGTLGGWTSEASAPHADSADDYGTDGLGTKDDDTTYLWGPNNADGSGFFLLTDTSAGFLPGGVSAITIKVAARKESAGVSGTADTIGLFVQVFKSDETTALTNEVTLSTNLGTSYVESSLSATQQGSPTKTDWDGARVRVRQDYTVQGCADTTTRARVTAVGVNLVWALPTGGPKLGLLLGLGT